MDVLRTQRRGPPLVVVLCEDLHGGAADAFAPLECGMEPTARGHMSAEEELVIHPDKIQKFKGIKDPWYVDASEYDAQDKWIYDALKNTDLSQIPDGEWNGEAIGTNIQGNPLQLDKNIIVFFTLGQAPIHDNVPTDFEGLKAWLPKQQSKYGQGNIEGIVWHCSDSTMMKIKAKDFK